MTIKRLRNPLTSLGLPLVALGLLAYALIFALYKPAVSAETPSVAPPSSPFASRVAGIGIVEPESESIAIGTNIPGIVAIVLAKVGEQVKEGDALFTIDDRDARAQLKLAAAQLDVAKSQAADARHRLSLYERVSDKRAISSDELSQRRYAAAIADGRVKEAEALVQIAATALERLSVAAPIDGEILRVNVRPGEYAPAGVLRDPLIVIGNTRVMHVRVEVDEADAQRVSAEAKATATLRGYSGTPIPLTFVRREPLVLPKRSLTGDGNERVDSRVLQVLYAFDNKTIGAFSGQQMDVYIEAPAVTGKVSADAK